MPRVRERYSCVDHHGARASKPLPTISYTRHLALVDTRHRSTAPGEKWKQPSSENVVVTTGTAPQVARLNFPSSTRSRETRDSTISLPDEGARAGSGASERSSGEGAKARDYDGERRRGAADPEVVEPILTNRPAQSAVLPHQTLGDIIQTSTSSSTRARLPRRFRLARETLSGCGGRAVTRPSRSSCCLRHHRERG